MPSQKYVYIVLAVSILQYLFFQYNTKLFYSFYTYKIFSVFFKYVIFFW